MIYWKAIAALFALMWAWALDTEDPPDEDPPEDNDDKPEQPFKAFASRKEHDAYVEAALKERLERKDKKLAEEKAETERLAREKALKDQEDWKKLAGEHAETIEQKNGRISELEQIAEERNMLQTRVTDLEDRLKGVMKPRLEAVPELFRPFVESMTVEEQAKWLEDNAEKIETNGEQRPRGSRPTGQPRRETNADTDAAKGAREGQRAVSRI